jgi:enoyl-CoA hydratase/carnithine racemase
VAYTSKVITAAEALALGLVNAVVPVARLDAATDQIIAAVVGGLPLALSVKKRELDNAANSSPAQSLNTHSDDLCEAMMAYAELLAAEFHWPLGRRS